MIEESFTMATSWGNYPKVQHAKILPLFWRDECIAFDAIDKSFLPYGLGRSYGDSCLNQDGVLLSTSRLNRFMSFDRDNGTLRCEAGVSLADILEVIVPQQWFLPVVPGTKFVTLGGAIANDIHGKNHHSAGTFGRHVLQFELLRSNGERVICSVEQNSELYAATIGGLGLTGLILWAEIKLMPVFSPFLQVEHIKFNDLPQFFELAKDSESQYQYTVAWIDCVAKKPGRGIFMRANHTDIFDDKMLHRNKKLRVPFYFPNFCLNRLSVKYFNQIYYRKQKTECMQRIIHYENFFFPLDNLLNWNRIYGKRGFLQYQCVIPADDQTIMEKILQRIATSGASSFLSVLKTFGDLKSPGMLSFPKSGVTLALDFPNRGEKTLTLLNELDEIVIKYNGKIYPAKDARMLASIFQKSYPLWKTFANYIDNKFSSSFWRRVML
jgi:FAD/FMN-containing dehydrogenase